MKPAWIVIWTVEDEPPRVLPYEHEADAIAMYERLTLQWSEVLLCRVERDAGDSFGRTRPVMVPSGVEGNVALLFGTAQDDE